MKIFSEPTFIKKCIILSLFLCFQSNANDLMPVQYGYGIRGWNGELYEKAEVHPILKSHPGFTLSDSENKDNKLKNKFELNIEVNKVKRDILATVEFKNDSQNSFFIQAISLPLNYSTIQIKKQKIVFSELCGESFLITTQNIVLDYLGSYCDYEGDYDRDDWVELSPGERINFSVKLNANSEFLPGSEYYNFETTEYQIVKEVWFADFKNKKLLFAILTSKEEQGGYIDIEAFMQRFKFDGIDKDNTFLARSNRVGYWVTGSRIKSLYENR